ncbi:MAG: hypothetical protein ACI38Y_06345, partial [Candidatus Methanomethylophilaceae archaeon]
TPFSDEQYDEFFDYLTDDEYTYALSKVDETAPRKRGNAMMTESINRKSMEIFGVPFIENGKIRKEHVWKYYSG